MASGSAFDGSAMDTTLQNSKVGWFSNAGIVKLNMILLLAQVSSYATGFDGSMMSMPLRSPENRVSWSDICLPSRWSTVFRLVARILQQSGCQHASPVCNPCWASNLACLQHSQMLTLSPSASTSSTAWDSCLACRSALSFATI